MELKPFINTAINYSGGNKDHVFVLSIPDWGVTPFAEGRDRNKIAMEIDEYNRVKKKIWIRRALNIMILPESRE